MSVDLRSGDHDIYVRIFDPLTTALLDRFYAVNPGFTGGLYVAGNL